jgi:hypothetical protein
LPSSELLLLSKSNKLVVQPPEQQPDHLDKDSANTHQLQLIQLPHQPPYNALLLKPQLGLLQLLALIIAIGDAGLHQLQLVDQQVDQLADQLVDQPADQPADQVVDQQVECHPKLNKSPNSPINSSLNAMLTRTLS